MRIIPLLLLLFSTLSVFSQPLINTQKASAEKYLEQRGEVYFCFDLPEGKTSGEITRIVSIQKIEGKTVYAYANKKEFGKFLSSGISFTVLTPPSLLLSPRMAKNIKDVTSWDYYPTYDDYISLMQSFQSAHPAICRLDTIGTTVQGRLLLVLKISDNVNIKEAEPEFLYSSSIHGDELTGYVLMLRLIDTLLSNYGTNQRITGMIDTMEIWINPLANPDGTYAGGNTTVGSATRGNANSIDMNRNFPDPQDGLHPDSELWQPETMAMMNFFNQHTFVMSANFHGGSVVINYPWDTWAQLHTDDNWLQLVCHEYADTAKAFGPWWYFLGYDNGITNGYSWYEVNGGRQDYMTYFKHGREITVELSNNGTPAAADLPDYWEYNNRSLLNFLEQCKYGIRGIVTDSLTGEPLKAKVETLGHDIDSSQVYCDSVNGNYHRLIYAGTWNLRYSFPGYISKTISGIQVQNYQAATVDVQLVKDTSSKIGNQDIDEQIHLYPNPFHTKTNLQFYLPADGIVTIQLMDISGKEIRTVYSGFLIQGDRQISIDCEDLAPGFYFYKLLSPELTICGKLIRE